MWPVLIGGFAALVAYLQYAAPLRYGFSWSFGAGIGLVVVPVAVDLPEVFWSSWLVLVFLTIVSGLTVLAVGFLRVRLTVRTCVAGSALFWGGLVLMFQILAWATAPYAPL